MSTTKLTPSKLLAPLENILLATFGNRAFSTNDAVEAYCTSVGITEDAWGYNETQGSSRPTYVRFQIIRTIRKSSKINSAGRGYYINVFGWMVDEKTLPKKKEEPVVIKNDSDMAEASTSLLNALTNHANNLVIKENAPVSYLPIEKPTTSDDLDNHIAELLAKATSCFTYFSSKAPTCKACPLRFRCEASTSTVLDAIAKSIA